MGKGPPANTLVLGSAHFLLRPFLDFRPSQHGLRSTIYHQHTDAEISAGGGFRRSRKEVSSSSRGTHTPVRILRQRPLRLPSRDDTRRAKHHGVGCPPPAIFLRTPRHGVSQARHTFLQRVLVVHPSRHHEICLSLSQLCGVNKAPLQLLNSGQRAPHLFGVECPLSVGGTAPRPGIVVPP